MGVGARTGSARAVVVAIVLVALLAVPASAAEREFPEGFLWGTSISGFQTEMGGEPANEDRGSDWWAWTHDPQNLADGTVSGDLPEDGGGHWRMYRTDIDLASRRLGAGIFRIGLEWSRVFPRSTRGVDVGERIDEADLRRLDALADPAAVAHYEAVVRRIRAAGMEPLVTLNHYTLPLWAHDPIEARDQLQRAGLTPDLPPPPCTCPRGWLDESTVEEFGKYSAYMAWKLGRHVTYWNPLNEPMVVGLAGFVNAPGVSEPNFPPKIFSWEGARRVIMAQGFAHGRSYDELHRHDPGARVVLVHNMTPYEPARPGNPLDERGAQHADYVFNRVMPNMVLRGDFDLDMDGTIEDGERALRGPSADVFGVNYYTRGKATGLPTPLSTAMPVFDFLPTSRYGPGDCPTTCDDLGRETYPAGLRRVLETMAEYRVPMLVTESGTADADDSERPRYLTDHLRVLRDAIRDGVGDIRGYMIWAIVDNYEWVEGFPPRFGLYAFDRRTLERRPRRASVDLTSCVFRTAALEACAAGEGVPTGGAGRVAARGLTARSSPRRDRRAPYRFTTTGRLLTPDGVARAAACRGRVVVVVKRGRRTLSERRVRLAPDCSYRSSVSFGLRRRVAPPRTLRVLVRFAGNAALLPRRARTQLVRAG